MPATFTLQNDAGDVDEANAYIDVAYFRQYHLDRGRDTTAKTDDQVKVGIVRATDYIDNRWRLRFAGKQKTQATFIQSTQWPREYAAYDNGVDITGLPRELKKACAEYALRAIDSELVADAPAPVNEDGEVTSGVVLETSVEVGGAISESKKYAELSGSVTGGTMSTSGCLLPEIPAADMQIEHLLDGSTIQRKVIRS